MEWKSSVPIVDPNGVSNHSGYQHSLQPNKPIRAMREGDWECQEEGCGNINFSKRTKCHRCGVPKPKSGDPLKDIPHFGGPPGLFKQGDWPCTHCGNVNWARRDKCNMCNAPKPAQKLEPRMGRGGGHFDLQDPSDRKKHDSDDEEYDEFGRKKKKKNKISLNNAYYQAYSSDAAYNSSRQAQNSYGRAQNPPQENSYGYSHNSDKINYTNSRKHEDVGPNRMAYPPAPKSKNRSRSRSKPRSHSSASSMSSSSSSSSSSSKHSRSRLRYRNRSRSRTSSPRHGRKRR